MKRLLWILAVLACAAAVGLAVRNAAGAVRIVGCSMEDTLLTGDIALSLRGSREPAFGDVVECRFPGRTGTYVKRLIGLPVDRVSFSGGTLKRNGTVTAEPWISSQTEDFEITLGIDEYLALGDNRAQSYDSRMDDMGPVHAEDILGRVRWILLPLDRFGPIK